ncbi:MAG: hypothetical protein [Caudoviricetes sp.]|nr:MAG: hypothetical protein [Caudoviricetes sp.]
MEDRVIIDDDSERITDPSRIMENDLVALADSNGKIQAFIRCNNAYSVEMTGIAEYQVFATCQGVIVLAIGLKDRKAYVVDRNMGIEPWDSSLEFKCAIRNKPPVKEGFYQMDNGEIREYSGLGSYRYLHGTEWFPESGDTYDGKFVKMRLEADSGQESLRD